MLRQENCVTLKLSSAWENNKGERVRMKRSFFVRDAWKGDAERKFKGRRGWRVLDRTWNIHLSLSRRGLIRLPFLFSAFSLAPRLSLSLRKLQDALRCAPKHRDPLSALRGLSDTRARLTRATRVCLSAYSALTRFQYAPALHQPDDVQLSRELLNE